jgi:HEAT repeat protein
MQVYFLTLVSIILWGSSLLAISEEDRLMRRIQAHITIQDYKSAVEEAQQALVLYPESVSLHEGYIRALAKSGEEKQLLEAWDRYVQRFPNKAMHRELIEEMAWGTLQKASHSSSIVMREMSLLAAFFSQEAKGVTILNQGMRDSNYAVRAVAVKLAAHFRDDKLIEEVKRLFIEEKVWAVRQQVIEAIGKMKIVSFRSYLEALIASDDSLAAEKALAITSLLELLDTINRPEIERLSSSNRAGLRQLACQAIAYFQSMRDLDELFRLAEDSQPDVRLEAFQAIGQLRPVQQVEKIFNLARQGVQDLNYQVALSAAWLLTLYAPEEGQHVFTRFLNDGRREVRLLAAAALGATGRYGMTLILDQSRSHLDPYVRLNLALGLIGQRQAVLESTAYLRQMLMSDKEKWSTLEVGLFRAIVNKSFKQIEDSITTPEVNNQLLRLELLNLLAILRAPETQQVIREYLLERSWEISATAAALLLTEGDESAIELVQELLQDRQPRIRLQAALILSLWSHEESAIQVLEEGYPNSEWELKARILEGLGRIGSTRSVPFLINVLKEPSQTLRLIAAMALIQCLNH